MTARSPSRAQLRAAAEEVVVADVAAVVVHRVQVDLPRAARPRQRLERLRQVHRVQAAHRLALLRVVAAAVVVVAVAVVAAAMVMHRIP